MEAWFGIGLIACLIFIAISYWQKSARVRYLEDELSEYEDSSEYRPVAYHMVGVEGSGTIQYLSELTLKAHREAGYSILSTISTDKGVQVFFSNGDMMHVFPFGAPIEKLKKKEIEEREHRVFIDNKLPAEATTEVLRALGLQNYLVSVGICTTKKSGG